MQQNETPRETEINIWDLIYRFKQNWKIITTCFLAGVGLAAIAIFLLPSKYQASLLIEVGQIGLVDQVNAKVSQVAIESPELAAERITTPSFLDRVADQVSEGKELQVAATWRRNNDFAIKVLKTSHNETPLIELFAYANTPDRAKLKAETALRLLAETHSKLAHPMLTRMNSELEVQREQVSGINRDIDILNKQLEPAKIRDDRFSQFALMESFRSQKETALFKHRNIIADYERALEDPATRPTRAFEAVFVDPEPVSPKEGILLIFGGLAGLLAGLILALLFEAFKKREISTELR